MSAKRCLTAWNDPIGSVELLSFERVVAGDVERALGDADEHRGGEDGAVASERRRFLGATDD